MLHVKTPLLESLPLSKVAGLPVYIKLENIQPFSSFKIRGIGNLCMKAKEKGCTSIVSSSGGNAGLAAAYAARKLGMTAKVVVPESTVQQIIDALKDEGADVEVCGRLWEDANRRAVALAQKPGCAFVHPYDHPDIWEGHSTMVDEIYEDLKEKPSAVVVAVGGGGLACGVIQGLRRVGWSDVPLVAMETEGAASLHASVVARELVTIPDITSIAKTLGARTVCQQLFDLSRSAAHSVLSAVVTDADAVNACLRFADDHRMLVEPACGAALAAVYSSALKRLRSYGDVGGGGDDGSTVRPTTTTGPVVVVVCGGNGVSLELLRKWKELLGL